jgi:hypothetical protein
MAPDDLQGIRIAVHGGDRSAIVRMLGGEVRCDALQLVGDAVAAALSWTPLWGADRLRRAPSCPST